MEDNQDNQNQQTFKIVIPRQQEIGLEELEQIQENIRSNLRLPVQKIELLDHVSGLRITLKQNARLSTVQKALHSLNIKYKCNYDIRKRGKYKKRSEAQNKQIQNSQNSFNQDQQNQIEELKKIVQNLSEKSQEQDLKYKDLQLQINQQQSQLNQKDSQNQNLLQEAKSRKLHQKNRSAEKNSKIFELEQNLEIEKQKNKVQAEQFSEKLKSILAISQTGFYQSRRDGYQSQNKKKFTQEEDAYTKIIKLLAKSTTPNKTISQAASPNQKQGSAANRLF